MRDSPLWSKILPSTLYLQKVEASDYSSSLSLDCAIQLVEALRRCKLPVITVCTQTECGDGSILAALSDFVISSHLNCIQMSAIARTLVGGLANLATNIIVASSDIDGTVKKLLDRLRKKI